jgi:hypothetical protein
VQIRVPEAVEFHDQFKENRRLSLSNARSARESGSQNRSTDRKAKGHFSS